MRAAPRPLSSPCTALPTPWPVAAGRGRSGEPLLPVPVPPSRRALPGLSPAQGHAPASPPQAATTRTRPGRSGISGAGKAALNLLGFTVGAPRVAIPAASHPLASPRHRTWGAESAQGDAGAGAGATAAKGCLLIRQQLRAWACLFKGYGNSVNNPLARLGGISSPPGREGAHMNMGRVGTQPCGNKASRGGGREWAPAVPGRP